MKVLLVDDHPAIRMAVRTVFEVEGDMDVVGEADDAREGLRLVEELKPDLVVLDLRLRGENGGIKACREMKALPDPPRVLLYTAYNSAEELAACRASGADGYAHKSEDAARLLEVVESIRAGRGEWLVGTEIEDPDAGLREASEAELTAREREVLALLRRRRTDPEIARELHISPLTAKTHAANVLAKLGLRSRKEIS
ncbi:MAG: response regulator transcription factor [Actinomycetota bacterium]|nr:response regulator transcription factor [Actinomycetota bacterium]